MSGKRQPVRDDANPESPVLRRSGENGNGRVLAESTLGRMLLNDAFPVDFAFNDSVMRCSSITSR